MNYVKQRKFTFVQLILLSVHYNLEMVESKLFDFEFTDLQGKGETIDFEQAIVLEEVGHGHGDRELADVAVDELEGDVRVLEEGVDVGRVEGDISQPNWTINGQLVEQDTFVEKRSQVPIDQVLANPFFEGI